MIARVLGLISLGVLVSTACNGPKLVTIPLSGFGTPSEAPITVTAGDGLTFLFSLDSYSSSARNSVSVDFELKKGSAVVATEMCPIFNTGKGSGCGWSTSSRNRGCSLRVPAGGADAIRATAKVGDASTDFEASGMSVSVHRAR